MTWMPLNRPPSNRAPWKLTPSTLTRPEGSPRNVWPATTGVERHGDNIRIQLNGPIDAAADITAAAAVDLHLSPGRQLWAAVKATETRTYPT